MGKYKAMAKRQGLYKKKAKVATVATVKRMINGNIEMKKLGTSASNTLGVAPVFVNIAAIGQGDDVSGRDGNKVKLESFNVKGYFTVDPDNTVGDVARVMLIKDSENTGTAPTETDIFGGASRMIAGYPVDIASSAQQRFKVIFDKLYSFDTSQNLRWINLSKKLGYPLEFTGAASTDEGKNTTYLVYSSLDDTNKMTFTGRITANFKDS